MAKKDHIKYQLVSSNIRKDVHSRIKDCMANNGYALRFAVEVGLMMFLKATHEERVGMKNSFVFRGRLPDKENSASHTGPTHSPIRP